MKPSSSVPDILHDPPWRRDAPLPPAKVVEGLEPLAAPHRMDWPAGLRRRWRERLGASLYGRDLGPLLADDAPPEVVTQFADAFDLRIASCLESWIATLVARRELDLLPLLFKIAPREPELVASHLAPYDTVRAAPLCADFLHRLPSVGRTARRWLLDHPEAAANGLVADAVGPTGKARTAAVEALRLLRLHGHGDLIEAAAAAYGERAEKVRDALADVLDGDPRTWTPTKLTALPAFWAAALSDARLPAPVLRGDPPTPLAAAEVDALGEMLAFSSPDDPYAGLADVRAACTAESLARFAWALFEAWLAAGAPPREKWAFHALAHFGDDDAARRLTPLLHEWPKQRAHARAVLGLEVLSLLGSDAALLQIQDLALRAKTKKLRDAAAQALDAAAAQRGLDTDALADRLFPTLGLGEDGGDVLDYGARRFPIVFTEALEPRVLVDGKAKKSPPRAVDGDAPRQARRAGKRWKALKRDVRAAAQQEIPRLERAMVLERRWTLEDFERYFLEHPLRVHLTRRLVWGIWRTGSLGGPPRATFCLGEDGRCLGEDGRRLDWDDSELGGDDRPTPDGRLGIVHPLALGAEAAKRWSERLADEKILPPFAQMDRSVHPPSESELTAATLERFAGSKAAPGVLRGAERRGWELGAVLDGGLVAWLARRLPPTRDGDEREMRIAFRPGFRADAAPAASPEQTLGAAWISEIGEVRDRPIGCLGDLSTILFSEIVRELEELRRSAIG